MLQTEVFQLKSAVSISSANKSATASMLTKTTFFFNANSKFLFSSFYFEMSGLSEMWFEGDTRTIQKHRPLGLQRKTWAEIVPFSSLFAHFCLVEQRQLVQKISKSLKKTTINYSKNNTCSTRIWEMHSKSFHLFDNNPMRKSHFHRNR